MPYVVFEETDDGRKILGKGETLNDAKKDWFKRTEFEDPIGAILDVPVTEIHPYDGLRIYGRVMCAKVDASHVSIDHENPRIVDPDYASESFQKARIEAAMRELEREKRSVRWYLFAQTWYGDLMIRLGLA